MKILVVDDEEAEKYKIEKKETQFLKDCVLLSLITGIGSAGAQDCIEHLCDKAELLNYHYMMLVEFKNDFFDINTKGFISILNETLNQNYHYLNLNRQQCILLFTDNKIERYNIALNIIEKIALYYKEECYISVSEYFDINTPLSKVYQVLGNLMKKRLYIIKDKVFLQNNNINDSNFSYIENNCSANINMHHKEIETVKQYIYENYNKELNIEMLAEQVYMAPSYLSHIFKKETGQNLSKFIKALRMEKAKEMLEKSHNKIVNISYAVGYPNVSYFCQSFREYFGISPQKYRKHEEEKEQPSQF